MLVTERGDRGLENLKIMKIILKTLYYIFFGALILVALVVAVSAFPAKGNIQIKVVESGSMEPKIKTGSVVLIKPEAKYAVGEIITFDSDFKDERGAKVPITHRVIEVKTENNLVTYLTKGDANEESDGQIILARKVIGKVLFDVPYVGYAIDTAKKPYGFLALILIPALILIGEQTQNIWREVKKMRAVKKDEEIV